MTGKDIFYGLNNIGADLIEEAEFAQAKTRRVIRPLMIAAIIALMLLLMGCAVALVLNMQNMKIADTIASQPVFSGSNLDITEYEEVKVQVLTLAGFKGSPNYQASQEWYRFDESYDPDLELYFQLYESGTLDEYPAEFGGMPIYTQEMRQTIDGILDKYHLLPPGEILNFRTLKNLCTALEIEKIQTAQNDIGIQITHGYGNSNGNFSLTMNFSMPEQGGNEIQDTWGILSWYRKDCFTPYYITIEDTQDWEEWNYTTASGSDVLIFRSPSDYRGWIVCQREEAQMVLELNVRNEVLVDSQIRYQYLTNQQVEKIADAIDFTIQPKKVTQEDVENQAAYTPEAVQNGWQMEVKHAQTDGNCVEILLGITAPEDRDISHVERMDDRSDFYDIFPGNRLRFFTPEQGEVQWYNWSWCAVEDGDGLDYTQDYLMTYKATMLDNTVPFADGAVWNLHIEDLHHHYWDSERGEYKVIILAEGEWNASIRFENGNGLIEIG